MNERKLKRSSAANGDKNAALSVGNPVGLSHRETEMTALAARGLTSRQIATRLCISIPTVEKHRNNILRKLGAANMVEVVAVAIRNGWIE
jgi:DNA-binding CsgD family transcriptional regulator